MQAAQFRASERACYGAGSSAAELQMLVETLEVGKMLNREKETSDATTTASGTGSGVGNAMPVRVYATELLEASIYAPIMLVGSESSCLALLYAGSLDCRHKVSVPNTSADTGSLVSPSKTHWKASQALHPVLHLWLAKRRPTTSTLDHLRRRSRQNPLPSPACRL